jgi:hypothetical protein
VSDLNIQECAISGYETLAGTFDQGKIMILYHFTGLEHLDAIMEDCLSIGDVPTSSTEGKTGVWFTTDQDPAGHGLGVEMDLPNGGRIPNKRAVRITVSIPSSDRKLVSWMKWGRKHCNPDMFDRLNRSGGGKCKSWYIYFSTVKPDQFSNIEILTSTPPRVVFAQLPDAHCSELRTIAPSLNLSWRAETYPCGQNIGLRLLSLRSRIRSR